MVHMTVHCTNCGTSRDTDITPKPPTPFVSHCVDCPSEDEEIQDEFSITVTIHRGDDLLTRLSGEFTATSLRAALDSGALSASLEPLWTKLQKHADIIDAES